MYTYINNSKRRNYSMINAKFFGLDCIFMNIFTDFFFSISFSFFELQINILRKKKESFSFT